MYKTIVSIPREIRMGQYLVLVRLALISIVSLTMLVQPAFCQEQAAGARGNAASDSSLNRPTVGLALGGGGARGAAHVSVLKVLKEEGIPVDYIAGTSIGSVVGGLYAAGVPLEQIEAEFHSAAIMRSFMTVPIWVRLIAAPVMVLPRLVGFHPYDGLYWGNKFRKFLIRSIPDYKENGGTDIKDLKIPYCAVVTSLVDGKVHALRKGDLGYAMQASCAVPGLRKPVEIDGDLYVDGGILVNVPVPQVREMGADFVIAVNIDEPFDKVPLETFRAMGSVSKRVIKLELADLDEPLCKQADFVIHPNTEGIGLVSRSKKDAIKGLKAGEEAARAAIPEIKKLLSEGVARRNAAAKGKVGQAL